MDADHTAVIAFRPEPCLLDGELSGEPLVAVRRWIALNSELLIDFWEGRASTAEMVRPLTRF